MGSAQYPAAVARATRIDPELIGERQRRAIEIVGESKAVHLDAEPNIFMVDEPIDFEAKRLTS